MTVVELGSNTGFAVAANRGFEKAVGLRRGRADQHRHRARARLAGADGGAAGGRARVRVGGVQDGRPGRPDAAVRHRQLPAPRRRLRAARALPGRRRALRRARRGVQRVRGRGAVSPQRRGRDRRLRRALLRLHRGRRPGAAAAARGLGLRVRAGRRPPRRQRLVGPAAPAGGDARRAKHAGAGRAGVPVAVGADGSLPPARVGLARGAVRRAARVRARVSSPGCGWRRRCGASARQLRREPVAIVDAVPPRPWRGPAAGGHPRGSE